MTTTDTIEIKICAEHHEHQVPLISTFAFMGAEYWCPYCGKTYGMFDAWEKVPCTHELIVRHRKYKACSDELLLALGRRACSSMEYNGKSITYDELPDHEKQRGNKAIEDYEYRVKL